ncbi:MAG: polysaccharide biosynthesis/export family protein [Planctomycetaceae bacterium]|nr:polysaccharide biosynthesis/export family protein [Planctomycetaceae bacterium]
MVLCSSSGCLVSRTAFWDPKPAGVPAFRDVGNEVAKSSLPHYYLECSDIITVDAVHLVPRSPYVLRVFDQLSILVPDTLEEEPIRGRYTIEPGGKINLGYSYGTVVAAGVSIDDISTVIRNHLAVSSDNPNGTIIDPQVTVQLASMGEIQQINGEHLIGPDGYITLGSYGRVYVNGLTVDECREAIEFFLSKHLDHPQIAVDVYSFNSKDYYVIFQSVARQEMVWSFPYTGNENVLKAISNVNGLMPQCSKRIWVARPVHNTNKPVILPVDWIAVTAYAQSQTNYQLLPGDRVYVVEDRWVMMDGMLAKWIAPVERVLGISMLMSSTFSGWQYYLSGATTGGYY